MKKRFNSLLVLVALPFVVTFSLVVVVVVDVLRFLIGSLVLGYFISLTAFAIVAHNLHIVLFGKESEQLSRLPQDFRKCSDWAVSFRNPPQRYSACEIKNTPKR